MTQRLTLGRALYWALTPSLVVLAVIGLLVSAAHGQGAPNCGGQNAPPKPTPYSCVLPPKVIDGTTFAGAVRANGNDPVVGQAGTGVEVVITIQGPTRNVPTLVRIVHHQGISGAGGAFSEASGTMAPGQRTIVLRDSAACRDGQLDVKVVFVANNQSQGRLGGPWIQNGIGCTAATTVPTSAPTTTGTPPSTVATSVPATTVAGSPPSPAAVARLTLPATGKSEPVAIAFVLIATGAFLVTVTLLSRRVKA